MIDELLSILPYVLPVAVYVYISLLRALLCGYIFFSDKYKKRKPSSYSFAEFIFVPLTIPLWNVLFIGIELLVPFWASILVCLLGMTFSIMPLVQTYKDEITEHKDASKVRYVLIKALQIFEIGIVVIMSICVLIEVKNINGKDLPNKPEPTPSAAVATTTPEPAPTPTPEPTLSPEELNKLIAREEALWRQEALKYAKENLPQNYKELVYEYYSLLEAYDDLLAEKEILESQIYDLEEEVTDLEDDLEYQRRY